MVINTSLIIRAGSQVGTEKRIQSDVFRIGRDHTNDLILDDIDVSRFHARIVFSGGQYLIEDLNSTNGTFLKGKKVKQPIELKDKDMITIGEKNVIEFSKKEEIQPQEFEPPQVEKPSQERIDLQQDKQFQPAQGFEIENPIPEVQSEKVLGKESSIITGSIFQKLPIWVVILLIALTFLVLFCLIPFIVIELTDQWCNLFSGFFNSISPGVCP